MKKSFIILIVFIILLVSIFAYYNSRDQDLQISEESEYEIILEDLKVPWAIDFLPSGELVFTERDGKVSLYDFNTQQTREIANIEVNQQSESGLLGIAVDPEFNANNFIYLYYTHDEENRVSRFALEDTLKDEEIILDNIPNAIFHDGGRIKFGPDLKLYITTGDATEPSTAQDLESLAGKILRINKDGSVPEDNPFGNEVYTYGHRNPQGLTWGNVLFASEHGPSSNDEINIIEKGNNYGWPLKCEEDISQDEFINPIRCYSEFTLAPSGIAFHNTNLYVAGLRGTQLRKLTLENNQIINEEVFIDNLGRIREVVEKDGYLYIATNNRDGRGNPKLGDDKIIRIKL